MPGRYFIGATGASAELASGQRSDSPRRHVPPDFDRYEGSGDSFRAMTGRGLFC